MRSSKKVSCSEKRSTQRIDWYGRHVTTIYHATVPQMIETLFIWMSEGIKVFHNLILEVDHLKWQIVDRSSTYVTESVLQLQNQPSSPIGQCSILLRCRRRNNFPIKERCNQCSCRRRKRVFRHVAQFFKDLGKKVMHRSNETPPHPKARGKKPSADALEVRSGKNRTVYRNQTHGRGNLSSHSIENILAFFEWTNFILCRRKFEFYILFNGWITTSPISSFIVGL